MTNTIQVQRELLERAFKCIGHYGWGEKEDDMYQAIEALLAQPAAPADGERAAAIRNLRCIAKTVLSGEEREQARAALEACGGGVMKTLRQIAEEANYNRGFADGYKAAKAEEASRLELLRLQINIDRRRIGLPELDQSYQPTNHADREE